MRKADSRSGVAATEFAIILPIIVILGIVPLELCNLIHVRQSVSVAAYEAVKVGTRPGGTEEKATSTYNQVISDRGIRGASIEIVPDLAVVLPGEEVAVTVSAPARENSFFNVWFLDTTPTSTVIMTKE